MPFNFSREQPRDRLDLDLALDKPLPRLTESNTPTALDDANLLPDSPRTSFPVLTSTRLPKIPSLPQIPTLKPLSLGLSERKSSMASMRASSLGASTRSKSAPLPTPITLEPALPSPSFPAVVQLPPEQLEQLHNSPGGRLASSILSSDMWAPPTPPRSASPAPSSNSRTNKFKLTLPFSPPEPIPVRERVISGPKPLRPIVKSDSGPSPLGGHMRKWESSRAGNIRQSESNKTIVGDTHSTLKSSETADDGGGRAACAGCGFWAFLLRLLRR